MMTINAVISRCSVVALSGLLLSGCYTTATPLFVSGVSLPIEGVMTCDNALYDVSKTGKGTYRAVSQTDGTTFDLVFVPSYKPLVFVLQAKIPQEAKYYYSSVSVSGAINYVTDETAVKAIADRHDVAIGAGFALEGEEDDERSFLRTVADRGTANLFDCHRVKAG